MQKPERGRMRVHHISNINKALAALQESGIRMVNISSDDINNGNPKLTLGLIWLIALSFDGQQLVTSQAISGIEKSLKAWVCRFTERHNLKVNDFTSAWNDGLAFLYILYETIPVKFDLAAAKKLHPIARLKMAFELAQDQLHVEPLLEPEDVNCVRPGKIFCFTWNLLNKFDHFRQKINFDVHYEPLQCHTQEPSRRRKQTSAE